MNKNEYIVTPEKSNLRHAGQYTNLIKGRMIVYLIKPMIEFSMYLI